MPLMPFPAELADLHPEGHAGRLVRGLCRRARAELLDRDRVPRRQLRRGRGPLDGAAAPRRRIRAHDAAAPCRHGDGRQRNPEPTAHPVARGVRRPRPALERVHRRRRLGGPVGHRHRHGQQRPRHRPGPGVERRRGDAGPAQPDAGRQHRAERAAALFALRRGPVARGMRPDRHRHALSAGPPHAYRVHGKGRRDRPAAARPPRGARLRARFRRGRLRLAVQVPRARRRLLLQRRLLGADRRGRGRAGPLRRYRDASRLVARAWGTAGRSPRTS